MAEFQLWMEGYAATGESGTAQRLYVGDKGIFEGETFMEAYLQYVKLEFGEDKPDYVHLDKPVIWGCRVYDNEKDARESFG